jgi:tetratricopeptide (TPR) repeat protein
MKKQSRLAAVLCMSVLVCTLYAAEQVKSASQLFNEGVQSQDDEDWYTASQNFLEAVQANPSYGDAWFHLAQCTYQLGQYDLALQYLDTAGKYERGNTALQNLRGGCYIALGRLSDARNTFNAVLKSMPNDVDARFGLAELELMNGRISGAEGQFQEALKRDPSNRKALLSLAFVSAELGKNSAAQNYMNQAMRFYSGEAEVHYLGAGLAAMNGNLAEAERQARTAVEINGSYDRAYELLASVLYSEKKYDDAIDICDFRIGRDRNAANAWYLKGLAQQRLNKTADAVSTWAAGLTIDPLDEVMRAALELQVNKSVPLEDTRRISWAAYHIKSAKEYAKRYDSTGESYEYQRALKMYPAGREARLAYAGMLEMHGLHELYLEQLKFLQQSKNSGTTDILKGTATAKEKKVQDAAAVRLNDTIEAYDSLLQDTLAKKWGVQPFYLDKTRWNIGIYYTEGTVQFVHEDNAMITAQAAADMFSGVAVTSVSSQASPVSGFGDAYRKAHAAGENYFVLLSLDEGSRDLTLNGTMYSGRTGTKMKELSFYGTGNNRYTNVLRRFRSAVLANLPIRGKILDRSGSDLLIDVGRSEMIKNGAVFNIVRKGSMWTADTEVGLTYRNSDILGTLTVTDTGEEVSQGVLEKNSFYDRINTGDEVVLLSMPEEEKQGADAADSGNAAAVVDNAPAADQKGNTVVPAAPAQNTVNITAEDLGARQMPAFVELIRSIY